MNQSINRGIIIITLFLILLLPSCSKGTSVHKADLVILNGKIVTMDSTIPKAQALAVKGERIVAVGSDEEIKKFVTEKTETIDMKGKLVIPGLIESHGHFSGLGNAKLNLDLNKAKNWDEVTAMVEEAVKKAKPGEWIKGRGWHQEKWDNVPEPNVDGLPTHHSISKISPDNPVYLRHASGHASFANANAMALADVDEKTVNPDGGEIVKDAKGSPIGIFRETASALISQALAMYNAKRTKAEKKAEAMKALELADQACLQNGVTTFYDAGSSFKMVDTLKELVNQNKLSIRLNVMLVEPNSALKQNISKYRLIGYGNNHLTVRGIKRWIDGALGSHGAWLLAPYTSMPSSSGLNTEPLDAMRETAKIAIENGFQFCTHAIGDRGNRETLDIYENTFKAHPDKKDLRWRIEHAQHLDPADLPRFAKLDIIASMQGVHCTSDGPWVPKRLGDKRAKEGAYMWRKLMDEGTIICNGTDVPVEDLSPIECYYSSVTRKSKDGSVFYGKQKMTREEALKTYTINGAYAAFQEKERGSITVGKLADITVLSKDILTIPAEEILTAQAIYTIIGGKVLYKK